MAAAWDGQVVSIFIEVGSVDDITFGFAHWAGTFALGQAQDSGCRLRYVHCCRESCKWEEDVRQAQILEDVTSSKQPMPLGVEVPCAL